MRSDRSSSKLIPKKWQSELNKDDVECFLCIDYQYETENTKAILGHNKWDSEKLQNLITQKGKLNHDDWRLPKDDQYLLIIWGINILRIFF